MGNKKNKKVTRAQYLNDAVKFIYSLHIPTSEIIKNNQINWTKAPSFFPHTQNKSRLELTLPIIPGDWKVAGDFDKLTPLEKLSLLLWLSYGCHKIRIDPVKFMFNKKLKSSRTYKIPAISPKRVIASGGACYPADLYFIFGKYWDNLVPDISNYIYQYSPNYHALLIHKKIQKKYDAIFNTSSNFLEKGNLYIILCNNFSRTLFKYGNFSYRLTAVDLGIVLNRLCYLFGKDNNIEIDFDFCCPDIDKFLDLDCNFEGSYVIIKILTNDNIGRRQPKNVSLIKYSDFNSNSHKVFLKRPNIPKELLNIHNLAQSSNNLINYKKKENPEIKKMENIGKNMLFEANELNTLISAIRNRESNADSFSGRKVNVSILLNCLLEALVAIRRIKYVNSGYHLLPNIGFYCALLNVNEYPSGLYHYNTDKENLDVICEKSLSKELTECLHLSTVNIGLSAFVIHVTGALECVNSQRGLREYRIQQMMIGAAIDAASIKASSYGLSAHPYLGFNSELLTSHYNIKHEKILAQICIGATRKNRRINNSIVF